MSVKLPLVWRATKSLVNIVGCRWASTASFKAADLTVELADRLKEKPDNPENCLFGKQFTDHMLTVEWNRELGWGTPKIKPLQNLSVHPATSALHYAVQLFEGMKAYRTVDNRIALFRPMHNMERMLLTAKRASLPEFDREEWLKCISELVKVDSEWVPHSTKASLYIRPTFIGTEPTLGVNIPNSALLYCIICPVGPYFDTGAFEPVSLMADPNYVRAFPGGVGCYKLGSNYGPTIQIQEEAAKRGCQQVLWLYGEDHQVTEVGTMNVFVYWINENGQKELATMPLTAGVILPGVTRISLLELAREWNEFNVAERIITMEDIKKALAENRLIEMFGAGTACVVCPISRILYVNEELNIPTMENNAVLSRRFLDVLTDIQYGRKESNWSYTIMKNAGTESTRLKL